uniref:Glutathione S-transferase Z2 n=1 Tax=Bemisia tabaci TaxID=7038 RepID=A0A6C0MF00_BEMTA|nr:glutathione S-transferase Z2 [Bemisia tabaci]
MSGKEAATLYSYWRSSCSYRVRIALNLKGIPYEVKTVNIWKKDEHLTPEYREINPMQQVPALRIDGRTLIDSISIMHYLEETRPEHPLLPSDPGDRAKVREIISVIASGIQPLQNVAVLQLLPEEERVQWAQRCINKGFTALEKLLANCAGKYCFGDSISIADCCLIPQVYNARRFKVDVEKYPAIARIDKDLLSHPAFKDAHPDNQPDAVKDAK